MIIRPYRLKQGSTIGIVAPAGPGYDFNVTDAGIQAIRELGFNIVLGKTVFKKEGYLAGDDTQRAEEINLLFKRKDIDGIVCLRGGYGSARILDGLDFRCIKENPKVFVGYSDIAAIHVAINRLCNMVTFHGPMVYSDFGNVLDSYTLNSFLISITSTEPAGEVQNPDNYGTIKILSCGEARGRIIGGNLSVITSTIGSPYEVDTKDKILFLEDICEEPYRVDRMLTQLMLSGKFQKCAGIVLGQWTGCEPEFPERSLSLIDVFYDRLLSLNIPVLYNVAFGHGNVKMTIPLGIMSRITGDGRLIFEESGVK